MDLLAVWFLFKETLHTKTDAKIDAFTGVRNFRRAFELPSLRTIFVFVFLLAFGFSFFTQFSQVYLVEKFSYNQSQIGDVLAWVGIWIALTQGVIAGFVAKKFSPEEVLRFSPLFLAISANVRICLTSSAFTFLNSFSSFSLAAAKSSL